MSNIVFDETREVGSDSETTVRVIGVDALLSTKKHDVAEEVMSHFENTTVLVTGAGGSVGSALVRTLAPVVSKLVLVDFHEPSLARTLQAVKIIAPTVNVVPAIVDLKNEPAVRNLLQEHTPVYVFHTAAFKHVDIAESNPAEAIHNNFLASASLASVCAEEGVKHFVFTSSDKAVHPQNILGASKRAVERYLLHMETPMNVTIARFVNVVGSSGSVVKVFENQINNGASVTVTDPEMERYLMSVADTVYLTLSAIAQTEQSEKQKQLFMLNPGQPMLIKDIAEKMIALSGKDIEITFTSVRSGEKIHEDLLYSFETLEETTYEDVMSIFCKNKDVEVIDTHTMQSLFNGVRDGASSEKIIELFFSLVPEYKK